MDQLAVAEDIADIAFDRKRRAVCDHEVCILATFQAADAVGNADMLRRIDGDGLQGSKRIHTGIPVG